MARRGYCSECGRDVWLGRNGGCQFGHAASAMSNVHDAEAPTPMPVPAGPPMSASPVPPMPVMPAPQQPGTVAAPFVTGAAAPALAPEPAYTPTAPYTMDMPLPTGILIGDTECVARRVGARVVDAFLVGILMVLVIFAWAFVAPDHARLGDFGAWAITVGIPLLYFAVLSKLWAGQTVGKVLFGIAVTTMQNTPPSMLQMFMREVGWIADGTGNGLLGLLAAIKSERNQRIGDMFAKTVVVRTR